jgi:hypothetical protein
MFQIAELLSTFAENLVVLSAVTQMSLPKYTGKKHLFFLWGGSMIMMVPILILNQIEAFSFVTIIAGFVCAVALTSLLSKRGILHGFTAAVIAYLIIHATDYIFIALFGLLDGSTSEYFHTFQKIMERGPYRLLFVSICKGTNIVLYICLRKHMRAVASLSRRYCALILVFGSLAYIVMTFLLQMVQMQSYIAMQSAILMVWLLLVICVVAIISIFVAITHYQQAEQRNVLLRTTNELMVDNYKKLNDIQQRTRREVHDFQRHLQVLQEFAETQNVDRLKEYLHALLSTPRQKLSLCNCGNEVIDAIINCKAVDAHTEGIDFQFNIRFSPLFTLEPVDICAILSNQIDNAFEACQAIPNPSDRKVAVKVWPQNDNVLFFQVANTVKENPFDVNGKLHTTKNGEGSLHGFGIQNIRDTAAKYGGELSNVFQDGMFISTVFLFIQ